MGLLSNPSLTRRNKLGRMLTKHVRKICCVFYVLGIAWLVCLAHPDFNHGTYLSENALSPGLVYPEAKQDASRLAQAWTEELRRERVEHKSTTPYAWILAKMKQIGLETHVHNFTLRYPFAGGKEYHGQNIYGILRAPRTGSTEGIIFSAPYRATTSVHVDITASVPLLLAFADFARRKNYWAKDLVFLVTEQEQLGMHAWLEAYHEGGIDDFSILKCGNLPARAGALQAALNLEIQDFDVDFIDVKIEGLNGQLPNLDMFNLVQRITSREGIVSGYKQTPRKRRRSQHSGIEDNLKHMLTMLLSQATGVPNGNHGLFHRYRIESVTIEAVKRRQHNNSNNNKNSAALPLLKTIEGISRSLNNLLERFHQSYFFYILVQNDRFVSIGDYMPCLILLVSPIFLKAFALWLSIDGRNYNELEDETSEHDKETAANEDSNNATIVDDQGSSYLVALLFICLTLFMGALCNFMPMNENVRNYFASLGVGNTTTVGLVLGVVMLIALIMPLLILLPEDSIALLHTATLLCLGIALVVVGLLNFALGFLLAIISVPLGILMTTETNAENAAVTRYIARIYAALTNPFIVVYLIVLYLTHHEYSELTLKDLILRALRATIDAITFALMDCIIYGNWLYTAITAVFFPLWALCWMIVSPRRSNALFQRPSIQITKKTN